MDDISLDKQIHIYSFDTSAVYTDAERKLEVEINQRCFDKSRLKAERELLSEYVYNGLPAEKAEKRYRTLYKIRREDTVELGGKDRIRDIAGEMKETNREIKRLKDNLTTSLAMHNGTRELREEYVVDKNVISVFESMLTRTLGMQTGKLYDDFMVIRTYYFDVIKDLILR